MNRSTWIVVLSFLIIITNNLFFNLHDLQGLHSFQVVLAIILLLIFTNKLWHFTHDFFPKKFEIPLFIAFIIVGRSTESIVRKALIKYAPVFYDEYKLYIFAVSIIIFLILVYLTKKKFS